jgi:hypothetical protein
MYVSALVSEKFSEDCREIKLLFLTGNVKLPLLIKVIVIHLEERSIFCWGKSNIDQYD